MHFKRRSTSRAELICPVRGVTELAYKETWYREVTVYRGLLSQILNWRLCNKLFVRNFGTATETEDNSGCACLASRTLLASQKQSQGIIRGINFNFTQASLQNLFLSQNGNHRHRLRVEEASVSLLRCPSISMLGKRCNLNLFVCTSTPCCRSHKAVIVSVEL